MKEKNEILKFLGIGMGGIFIALQSVAALQTVTKTEQGHRQERMKNAIEHLGNQSESVRLGGAYELFHLAEDTEELRQTVLDILCAHIRHTTGDSTYQKTYGLEPSVEVQNLLTLLFVQPHKIFRGLRVNLKKSYLNRSVLEGAQLQHAQLQGAVLSRAQLQGAVLYHAQLQGAVLDSAQLQGAVLDSAQLQEAVLDSAQLQRAQLQGAVLYHAQLQGAVLYRAQLQGAVLDSAQLQGAVLSHAQLQRTKLSNAQLEGAVLSRTQLEGAKLSLAQLQGAVLSNAQLQRAVLYHAQLQRAQLQGAVLDSAQLQGAVLSHAQLQGAVLSHAQLQGAVLSHAQLQGAVLDSAQLQGAVLERAQLQGITEERLIGRLAYEDQIRKLIGKKSAALQIRQGGWEKEKMDSILAMLPKPESRIDTISREAVRRRLEEQLDETSIWVSPKDLGAVTGSYTEKEAELWIFQYRKALHRSTVQKPGLETFRDRFDE